MASQIKELIKDSLHEKELLKCSKPEVNNEVRDVLTRAPDIVVEPIYT